MDLAAGCQASRFPASIPVDRPSQAGRNSIVLYSVGKLFHVEQDFPPSPSQPVRSAVYHAVKIWNASSAVRKSGISVPRGTFPEPVGNDWRYFVNLI